MQSFQNTNNLTADAIERKGYIEITKLVPESELKKDEFKQFLGMLAINYKRDFSASDGNNSNYLLAKSIFDVCRSENWTRTQFVEHFKKFIMSNRWDNFNMADFFKGTSGGCKLYPESWKANQYKLNSNCISDIEGFEIPLPDGKSVVMYRFIDPFNPLPYKKVFGSDVRKARYVAEPMPMPEPKQKQTNDTSLAVINQSKEVVMLSESVSPERFDASQAIKDLSHQHVNDAESIKDLNAKLAEMEKLYKRAKEKVELLSAEIDLKNAKIERLTVKVASLQAEINGLNL